jgi:cytochrome c-type biogenesis protein
LNSISAEGPALAALALVAGVLSFSSPCTLPLVPGYISYLSGVRTRNGRAAAAALLFVAGFAFVFTAAGAAASGVGQLMIQHRLFLDRVAGAVIVLLGLFLLGLLPVRFLQREARPLLEHVGPGPGGALFLGLAFAVGWTPCIGPVLGSVILLAGSRETVAAGAFLLLLYSLGLGIPFLLAALFLDRFRALSAWLRRHAAAVNSVGGLLLVGMGVLVFTDRLQALLAPALELYARLKWPPL